jgi:hypothetical protein
MDPTHVKHLRTTASSRHATPTIHEDPATRFTSNGAASAAPRFAIQAVVAGDRIRGRTGSGGPLAGS